MGRVMSRPPKYVHHKRDRNGGPGFWYFERPGFPRVRLPGLPWSPKFMEAYEAALSGEPIPIGAKSVQPGTMGELVAKYYGSSSFKNLERSTQQVYRRIIERIRERHGAKRVSDLEIKHVRRLVSEIQAPTAAKRFLSILRILLEHAVSAGMIDQNPAATVRAPKNKTKGFHTWTEDEVAQFEAHWPVGTRERLAMALMLYTGQRRSDIVRMGPQHVRGGMLTITQCKTRADVVMPLLESLDSILRGSPSGHLAFLVTAQGKPFTAAGFGNWFREACDAAGLPQCSAHGLRKASAVRLAEAGCSAPEIMAITGHKSLKEAERYIREVNQKKLAESAQAKIATLYKIET